jgi:hypothetical protein
MNRFPITTDDNNGAVIFEAFNDGEISVNVTEGKLHACQFIPANQLSALISWLQRVKADFEIGEYKK